MVTATPDDQARLAADELQARDPTSEGYDARAQKLASAIIGLRDQLSPELRTQMATEIQDQADQIWKTRQPFLRWNRLDNVAKTLRVGPQKKRKPPYEPNLQGVRRETTGC